MAIILLCFGAFLDTVPFRRSSSSSRSFLSSATGLSAGVHGLFPLVVLFPVMCRTRSRRLHRICKSLAIFLINDAEATRSLGSLPPSYLSFVHSSSPHSVCHPLISLNSPRLACSSSLPHFSPFLRRQCQSSRASPLHLLNSRVPILPT